jgi:hypothetical protein
MRSVFKSVSKIPTATKAEYKRAISEWVESLPHSKAEAESVFVSGIGYSPRQLLDEVKHETEFGRELLDGLYALSHRLTANKKGLSIVRLIEQSTCNQ